VTSDPGHKLFDLVESARSGSRAALEELTGLFHKEIFRMVFYRTGSRMDAEDLTQEIFFKMSKNLDRLKDPARFKAWLYRIALNRVRDFHRKERLLSFFVPTPAVEETEPSINAYNASCSVLDRVMEKEFWHQFHGLTRQLSRNERDIFLLRYIDQLGIREIAETLKKSESTVKTHLYRALRKFRQSPGLRSLLKET